MKCSRFCVYWLVVFVFGLGTIVGPGFAHAQTRPLGIDVSSYQGSADTTPTNINWVKVKSSGVVAFAWAKAAEGNPADGYHTDPDFAANVAAAKAAGVLIGAYYFPHPELDLDTAGADTEAGIFWNVAKNYIVAGGSYLMPMLDYEQVPGSHYTKATSSQWCNRWCQDIVNFGASNGVVLNPIVYTYISFASTWIDTTVTNRPLWMASPNGQDPRSGAPNSVSPWPTWTFWQYGGTNINGIEGSVDGDSFNGTTNDFKAFIIGGLSISNQPASQTIFAGSNATFSVTAGGGSGAFHYQWQFNGTNISGATNSKYTLLDAKLTNGGGYSVIVTNNVGSLSSAIAYLSVEGSQTNAPTAILAPANMVNWWQADGNTIDIFGGANGTPMGTFYYVPGNSSLAYHFDGNTTILTTTAGDLAVPWTVCMWVNRQNSPQVSAGLLEDGTYSLKLEQYTNANSLRQVGLSVLSVGDYVFAPAYTVPANTWTHLAFVGTSSGTSFYANGVLKGTLTNSIPLPRKYIGAAYITSSAKYVDFMLGGMDDLMTFNRALSTAEISSIYNAGAAGFIRGPIITGADFLPGGKFQLLLKGFTGKNFFISSSSNLTTWSAIGIASGSTGTNQFTDNSVTNTQTFYRVYQP